MPARKFEIKEGMQIGKSIIIKLKGKNKFGCFVYVLQCQCGNIFDKSSQDIRIAIQRKTELSCGCTYKKGNTTKICKLKKLSRKLKRPIKKDLFFCPKRDKLDLNFYKNPLRQKCYQHKFCLEKKCLTFDYSAIKLLKHKDINKLYEDEF
ncbi:MAG TPA: hypothetical protein PKY81_16765 [bacterium]|mgnify:FL=1|nr:hypothetical protein [bacterium]HPN32606.1 hypothetical protein [bacterium]